MSRLHQLLLGTVAAAVAVFATALTGALLALAAPAASYQVLVADGVTGTVYVIQAGSATASIPAPVSGGIQSLAISPDGSRVYVAFKDGQLGVIDTASDAYLGQPVDLGSTSAPGQMVFTPSGKDLYVAETGLNQVVEVDTSTNAVVGSPIALPAPQNLAITPDGSSLFVDGGSHGNSVSVVATATNTVSPSTILVTAPSGLIVSPDGSRLYVLTVTSSGPGLAVVDTTTGAVIGSTIELPPQSHPQALALSPNGTELYVTDPTGQELSSIALATGTVDPAALALPQGLSPGDIAITADGSSAFVDGTAASGGAEVVAVDLATGIVGSPSPLTGVFQPAGLVIAPVTPTPTPIPSPTPTPSPTPAPTCTPGPIMIGPVPITVPPAQLLLPTAPSGVSSTGSAPSANASSSTSPESVPPVTILPPQPSSSPSPDDLPGFGPLPIICQQPGPLMVGPLAGVASVARGTVAQPQGNLFLAALVTALGMAGGGAAMAVKSGGFSLARFRR